MRIHRAPCVPSLGPGALPSLLSRCFPHCQVTSGCQPAAALKGHTASAWGKHAPSFYRGGRGECERREVLANHSFQHVHSVLCLCKGGNGAGRARVTCRQPGSSPGQESRCQLGERGARGGDWHGPTQDSECGDLVCSGSALGCHQDTRTPALMAGFFCKC